MKIIGSELKMVSAAEIHPHPENPRSGNVNAIAASIAANGFFSYLVVQLSTGYILCGNHRFEAGVAAEMTEFPVIFVDCNSGEALRILIADNRTSDLAGWNLLSLVEMLDSIAVPEDVGFSAEDIAAMHATPPVLNDSIPEFEFPGVIIRVGEYSIPINRDVFQPWIEDIRQYHGFDKDSITEEILCRLKLYRSRI